MCAETMNRVHQESANLVGMDEKAIYLWNTPPAPPEDGDGKESWYTFRIWCPDVGTYEWVQMGKSLFMATLKWKRLTKMLRRKARKTVRRDHRFEEAAEDLLREFYGGDVGATSSNTPFSGKGKTSGQGSRSAPYNADEDYGRPLLPWQVAWDAQSRLILKRREEMLKLKSTRYRNPFSAGALLEAIVESEEPPQPSPAEWLSEGARDMDPLEGDSIEDESTLDILELSSGRTDSEIHQRLSQELIAESISNEQAMMDLETGMDIQNGNLLGEAEDVEMADNSVWV